MSTLLDEAEIGEAVAAAGLECTTSASLLDIQEIRRRVFPLSVEAYIATMEGQPTELLRGIIIAKAKSPDHDYLSEEVREILARQVPPDCFVVHERAFRLADSVPEPDAAVVRGRKTDYRKVFVTTAVLAVEIAITTLSTDRAKAFTYAEAEIAEYWIVIPERNQVEVYRQPSPAGYAEKLVVTAPAVLHSSALPGVSLDLAALFA
jgi:Uma2 family endonuclease